MNGCNKLFHLRNRDIHIEQKLLCVVRTILLIPLLWMGSVREGRAASEIQPGVFKVGELAHPALVESSGLARSPTRADVFWTHNDTGSPAFLFAIDETGRHIGAYEVQGAFLIDWEAVTTSDGFLYFADTGTNGMARSHSAIHKVREPDLGKSWGPATVLQTWFIRFPGEREDCESLFILDGYCYLIGKYPLAGVIPMYRFTLSDRSESILLEKVTDIPVPSPVSDAALSADRRRLGLVSEDGALILFIEGDPAAAGTALQRLSEFKNDSIEGGVFTSEGFLTTSELIRDVLLFADPLLEGAPAITTPLLDLTAFVGDTVRFAVVAEGDPPPIFEWRFNGALLPGQTNTSLTLSNLSLLQAGAYEVTARNSAGGAVSAATLAVLEKVIDLRITEVMSSENPNSNPTSDWWELTSFFDEPVILSGWRFKDSQGGLSTAFVLPPGVSIRPGESIVFVEKMTRDEFLNWWGGANIPGETQIITYSGASLSFRADGDSLRLWDANAVEDGDLIARVDFGAARQGVTFGYDPAAEVFGGFSQEGVHGAFRAETGGDIGSPGKISEAGAQLTASISSNGITLSIPAPPTESYTLEQSVDLKHWELASRRIFTNSSQVKIEWQSDSFRYFRLRRR